MICLEFFFFEPAVVEKIEEKIPFDGCFLGFFLLLVLGDEATGKKMLLVLLLVVLLLLLLVLVVLVPGLPTAMELLLPLNVAMFRMLFPRRVEYLLLLLVEEG